MDDNDKMISISKASDEAKEITPNPNRRVTRPPADHNDLSNDYETD